MEELGEVPSSIHFDVGYYEKRSTKSWLVTSEDLELMYSSLKSEEISLWCDADPHDDKKSDGKGKKTYQNILTNLPVQLIITSTNRYYSMVCISVYGSRASFFDISCT